MRRDDESSACSTPATPIEMPSAPAEVHPAEEIGTAGHSFCAMPFQHLCIGNEGTALICCMARDPVSEKGVPLSLYKNSYREIWNSPFMREIRRKILSNERVPQCQVCYDHEASTSTSYRTRTGQRPLPSHPLDLECLRKEAAANNYSVSTLPGYLKLELGNLCNLKCRMCCSANSSEIERDPVHTMWDGGNSKALHAVWEGTSARIGPERKIGITRHGLYDEERTRGICFYWTNGSARFELPTDGHFRVHRLSIGLNQSVRFNRECRVLINGQVRFEGSVSPETAEVSIELDQVPRGLLVIDVLSNAVFNSQSQRHEGLPLLSVMLFRLALDKQESKEVLGHRLGSLGPWYKNDSLIFDEILANANQLERLYVTGGEPLLELRFAEILDYLIENNFSPNIHLEITTNGTIFNESLFAKFKRFNSLNLMLSLDGVAKTQEYIRYPSRWETIDKNIYAMNKKGFNVTFVPTVQAYNMLNLVELARFAHKVGAGLTFGNLLNGPHYLATSIMPTTTHQIAAKRLRELLGDSALNLSDALRTEAASLVRYFEAFTGPFDHSALRLFNLFTNDLDVSRCQSFRESLPELYESIAEAGYIWTDEIAYGSRTINRKPARDRLHAWI